MDGDSNAISFSGSNNRVVNYGQITAGNRGIYMFTNSGLDAGAIYNYGSITGKDAIGLNVAGSISIYNYGRINGSANAVSVFGGLGSAYLVNRGLIDGNILRDDGPSTLINRGTISGNVQLGGGIDFLDNRGGTIDGLINMGGGVDTYKPGTSQEIVNGGGQAGDLLDFKESGTVHLALDGSIAAIGAAMGDTYTGFDSITGSLNGSDILIGDAQNNRLEGLGGNDSLTGLDGDDVLAGGLGSDTLDGGNGTDTLNGGDGNDILVGGDGTDILDGGAGNDTLNGGLGGDSLTGGPGADKFVFGPGEITNADGILDFNSADKDRIDLSAIDANTALKGDQAFIFIGTDQFHNIAGELRYTYGNGTVLLQADTNGDGVRDFSLGLSGLSVIAATDFVL